jgi:hypothetical protein
MDRQRILDLYAWAAGICFRHPDQGEVATAHVETIHPAGGGLQDVRACGECVLAMEAHRAAVAERQGKPYIPGRLGGGDNGY